MITYVIISMTFSNAPYSIINKCDKKDIAVLTCPHEVLKVCSVSRLMNISLYRFGALGIWSFWGEFRISQGKLASFF
jgi:hypothetical protein